MHEDPKIPKFGDHWARDQRSRWGSSPRVEPMVNAGGPGRFAWAQTVGRLLSGGRIVRGPRRVSRRVTAEGPAHPHPLAHGRHELDGPKAQVKLDDGGSELLPSRMAEALLRRTTTREPRSRRSAAKASEKLVGGLEEVD